jgi:hypothetical protein
MPEWTGWSSVDTVTARVAVPRRLVVRAPVHGIGNDDDIARECGAMRLEQVGERRRSVLFFTLNEDDDAEVRIRPQGLQRTQCTHVGHHPGLVVSYSSPICPLPHPGDHKRIGLPGLFIACRLNVVVGV